MECDCLYTVQPEKDNPITHMKPPEYSIEDKHPYKTSDFKVTAYYIYSQIQYERKFSFS